MPKERDDEISSEQLTRVLQKAMLLSYPNPNRIGCRGTDVLREMAERKFPNEHPFWDEHVEHCSPCYKVFLDYRNEILAHWDREERNRKISRITAVTAIVLLVAGAIYVSVRGRFSQSPPPTANHIEQPQQLQPQNPPAPESTPPEQSKPAAPQVPQRKPEKEPPLLSTSLNFENDSTTRELPAKPPQPSGELQRIPRGRLALRIYLPFGSEAGDYEVHLLKNESDLTPLAAFRGKAQIENGSTALRIAADLSKVENGVYVLAIRQDSRSWRYYRFSLS